MCDRKPARPCGLFTWFGYQAPFAKRLAAIRDAGFQTVSTWWSDQFASSDGARREQVALTERYGLRLEHAHLAYYGCDSLWRPGAPGEELLARYASDVEEAACCGVPTLVFHPFEKRVPAGGDWALFTQRFRRLADCARHGGVRLAVENLGDPEALRRILEDSLQDPAVGLCFDSGHANVTSHGDFSLLTRYPDRIFALHLHDNNGKADQHLLPLQGNIPWTCFVNTISQTSYAGSFLLESTYPFDYESWADNPDVGYVPPAEPMEQYLSDARNACINAFASEQTEK